MKRKGNKALLIVDPLKDFCAGGKLPVPDGQETVDRIADHLEAYYHLYDAVVLIKEWHIRPGRHFDTWPEHCLAASDGARVANVGIIGYQDATFNKGQYSDGYSGFEGINSEGDSLNEYLLDKEIERLVIVGIAVDHCVRATALDGIDNGYSVKVLLNLTAGVDTRTSLVAIAEMAAAGVKIR